jgi:hypothetical protein
VPAASATPRASPDASPDGEPRNENRTVITAYGAITASACHSGGRTTPGLQSGDDRKLATTAAAMAAVANAEAMATYRVTDLGFIGGRVRCGFVGGLDASTRHVGLRNTHVRAR